MPRSNKKNRNIGYTRGASVALGLLIQAAIQKNLSAEDALRLAICFHNHVDKMVLDDDIGEPFLTKALARSLEILEIEDYESACNRIIENPLKQP